MPPKRKTIDDSTSAPRASKRTKVSERATSPPEKTIARTARGRKPLKKDALPEVNGGSQWSPPGSPDELDRVEVPLPKRGRGRPPKNALTAKTNGVRAPRARKKQEPENSKETANSEDELALVSNVKPKAPTRTYKSKATTKDGESPVEVEVKVPKRKPGRPPKAKSTTTGSFKENEQPGTAVEGKDIVKKRGPGRPRKVAPEPNPINEEIGDVIVVADKPARVAKSKKASEKPALQKTPKRPRGRPPKKKIEVVEDVAEESEDDRAHSPTPHARTSLRGAESFTHLDRNEYDDEEPNTPSRTGRKGQATGGRSTVRTNGIPIEPPPAPDFSSATRLGRKGLLFQTEEATEPTPKSARRNRESIASEDVGEDIPTDAQTIIKPRKEARPKPVIHDLDESREFDDSTVELLKTHVMRKLTGRPKTLKREALIGLDEEYKAVHHLLEQTVSAGEGNSMLLIGARGVGKSMLVDTAISELREQYEGDFLVVRLNGFMQTDDKIASREIWRQLGVEMDADENTGIDGIQPKTTNFSDTLTSILAVLSHPSEHVTEEDGELEENKTTVSVIFILEEFDQFVTHPRQALLYNLFDIAQARKAPIAVLGLTSRIDVVESLEKRVKSRFSHRTTHIKLPKGLEEFWEVCQSSLEVDIDELREERPLGPKEIEYYEKWNDGIDDLYDDSPTFRTLIRRIFATSKSIRAFHNALLLPIHALNSSSPFLPLTFPAPALPPPESKLQLLAALPDLALALLISACRLEVLTDSENVNFNMVYEEYARLASTMRMATQGSTGTSAAGGKVWGREVAMGAWEELDTYELIVPGIGASGGGREWRMWRLEVGLRDVGRWLGRKSAWARWCKEV